MCARSVSLLFLLLFSFPFLAQAKKTTFTTGSAFALGVRGGLESAPATDFAVQPQSSDASYSYFIAIEPYLDFTNFLIRFSAALHNHPLVKGSGSDSTGNF